MLKTEVRNFLPGNEHFWLSSQYSFPPPYSSNILISFKDFTAPTVDQSGLHEADHTLIPSSRDRP